MKLGLLLYVSDLSRSIRFYRDVLGFRIGDLFPSEEAATYAPVFIGENKLMLCLARDSNNNYTEMDLADQDYNYVHRSKMWVRFTKRIKNKVKLIQEIETREWGDREFSLADPDGYLISYYSPSD